MRLSIGFRGKRRYGIQSWNASNTWRPSLYLWRCSVCLGYCTQLHVQLPASCTVVGTRFTLGHYTSTETRGTFVQDCRSGRTRHEKQNNQTSRTGCCHGNAVSSFWAKNTHDEPPRDVCFDLPLQAGSTCVCDRHGPCAPIAQSR